ncbi:ribonuclease H-like YkuK family protein [Brevibacillus humidisoli]|uniref:ribonuclease H-like YkuK family protein n=1 Tax=Brevibacillus humidisoli TaxID=2895522 RepID=UPI001E422531|nr:ribonuclease H-like YkuK family protein [Brevibacillus humidisoli]UFJ40505.1 ribonuclease H-like YkuK family protein [Brevibacillus humidisoli]
MGGTTARQEEQTVYFRSPTKGLMDKSQVFADIEQAVSWMPGAYEIVVGTDSQVRHRHTSFVIAISVIRTGSGGTFFYYRFQEQRITSLQQRVYMEAFHSVCLAAELREYLKDRMLSIPIRLHFDIGHNGPTHKYVKRLMQLAKANDFEAHVKPDSFGASTIADKFTK